MTELKTKANNGNVEDFLNAIDKEQKREDAFRILEIMKEVSGEEPRMWGDSIIGFGEYQYVYASGREGTWFKVGFSPRKQNFSLYVMSGFRGAEDHLDKLGKFKTAKACLYVNKLADIDEEALRGLIRDSLIKLENNEIEY